MHTGIIGLGLIGGSVAMALAAHGDWPCWGVDCDADTRAAALACGAVTHAWANIAQAPVEDAGLLLLCLPPQAAEDCLRALAPRLSPGTVVSDVCGVKRPLAAIARQVLPPGAHYIGGHPMAGRERGGFAHASLALFRGSHYLLTPGEDAPPEAVALLRELARRLGCLDTRLTDPETHDRAVAYTSQMMHVLALAICEQELLPGSHGFEGGSFQGATRVAAMDVGLWLDLFWRNRDNLAALLRELEGKLADYRGLLQSDDPSALRRRMTDAAARKEAWNRAQPLRDGR
ncbi:MAG: prephenate dehydrogenase [Oscillospiraceae bacterium]|jgi:prephenate dehydrogenase|nr:prephenate dehydrogenase [Oscillospiraceae bacterium]